MILYRVNMQFGNTKSFLELTFEKEGREPLLKASWKPEGPGFGAVPCLLGTPYPSIAQPVSPAWGPQLYGFSF